jgi:hypothetical protein
MHTSAARRIKFILLSTQLLITGVDLHGARDLDVLPHTHADWAMVPTANHSRK